MRVKILLGLLILLLISLLFIILNKNSTDIKKDIESGELSYTCNCGWINWGHALQDGVNELINNVVNDSIGVIATKQINYSQKMEFTLVWNVKIVAEVKRNYVVHGKLTVKEREQVAFLVLKETSESFEKMQGSFPYSFINGSQNSSFKDGDLTGDNIAFYKALKGYTNEDIVKMCDTVSKNQSLELWKEGKYGTNKQWWPYFYLSKGKFPRELNEISIDTTFLNKNLTFIDEAQNVYIDF